MYHQIGRIASAVYCYKKLLDCGTIYAKKNASWELSEISMDRGDAHDAYLYLKVCRRTSDVGRRGVLLFQDGGAAVKDDKKETKLFL